MRAAPGEERLRLRAPWQGVTGARRSSVLGLLAVGAVLLMAFGYGIATSGRAARQEAAALPDTALGNGGEWLAQIADKPRSVTPPPTPAPPRTPPTPANQDAPLPVPPVTVGPSPVPGATAAKPLSPEEQYRLELEKKRHEALLAAYVASPVSGTTAGIGSALPRSTPPVAGTPAHDETGLQRLGVASRAAGGSEGSEDAAQN